MSQIQILSETLRNQIAAGEVVERPSSVVKELVENALDADAKNIEITLEESGVKKIQVRDDGKGMTKQDAVLSVKRHATSKISKKDDLFNIGTLGFRGEALASIASISLFRVETKQADALAGTKVEVHAGHELDPQECACNTGTCVTVEDLFDNVPARKKFLKAEKTELKHCVEIVEDIAFCNPEVSFVLTHNGKEILKVFAQNAEERVKAMVSPVTANSLIPVEFDGPTVSVRGFVSQPGEIFKTRNYQRVFVNGRSIKDSTVQAAVADAYRSFLERGAYPAFYLFLDVPADLVDVNVHPRKSEVKFLRGSDVFSAVRNALLQGFEKKHKEFQGVGQAPVSGLKESARPSIYPSSSYGSTKPASSSFSSPNYSKPTKSEVKGALEFTETLLAPKKALDLGFEQQVDEYDDLGGYRIVGQSAKKFLILEKDDRVIFLDQHAVHERARYDEFMRAYKEKKPESQKLLIPEVVQLSVKEFLSVQEHLEFLERVGFELEEFGNNTFQILAIPVQIPNDNLKEVVVKVCEELGESGVSREIDGEAEKALTYLSCRGSIMFGDELSLPEMKAIVKDWLKYAKGLTCPHGRPLGFEMTVKEMEKKVGR